MAQQAHPRPPQLSSEPCVGSQPFGYSLQVARGTPPPSFRLQPPGFPERGRCGVHEAQNSNLKLLKLEIVDARAQSGESHAHVFDARMLNLHNSVHQSVAPKHMQTAAMQMLSAFCAT